MAGGVLFRPERELSQLAAGGRSEVAGMRVEAVGLPALIPTGLRHSAQGCPRRTTLGQSAPKIFNPNGVVSIRQPHGVQPFQGCDRFDSEPKVARCAQPWADGWNPVGIRAGTAQRAVLTGGGLAV